MEIIYFHKKIGTQISGYGKSEKILKIVDHSTRILNVHKRIEKILKVCTLPDHLPYLKIR